MPLEKGTATHSSLLAWSIPWTEQPGGLQSVGSQSGTRLSDSARTANRGGVAGRVIFAVNFFNKSPLSQLTIYKEGPSVSNRATAQEKNWDLL